MKVIAGVYDARPECQRVFNKIRSDLHILKAEKPTFQPKLVIIQIGECAQNHQELVIKGELCGIKVELFKLDASISSQDLEVVLRSKNTDDSVDGIALEYDASNSLSTNMDYMHNIITPEKDVAGLCTRNAYFLRQDNVDDFSIKPVMAEAVYSLVASTGNKFHTWGKQVVILTKEVENAAAIAVLFANNMAQSTIVLLDDAAAKELCRKADILILTIGCQSSVHGGWVKQGSVVVDLGYNSMTNETGETIVVGDADWASVKEVASVVINSTAVHNFAQALILSNTLKLSKKRITNS